MPRKVSEVVLNRQKELWALMATVAAKKAINMIEQQENSSRAIGWAELACEWMEKSGARQMNWTYSRPQVQK